MDDQSMLKNITRIDGGVFYISNSAAATSDNPSGSAHLPTIKGSTLGFPHEIRPINKLSATLSRNNMWVVTSYEYGANRSHRLGEHPTFAKTIEALKASRDELTKVYGRSARLAAAVPHKQDRKGQLPFWYANGIRAIQKTFGMA